jgi:hypothetical protein
VTPGAITSFLGSGGPEGGADEIARAAGAAEGARGGADGGVGAGGDDDAARAASMTPDAGAGGAELLGARGWTEGCTGGGSDDGVGGISPALRRRCIADSNASFRVAGGGGIARQLAIRLRRRLASTSSARVRADASPCVSSVMVSSRAPSAMFQDAELGRGTMPPEYLKLVTDRPEE